MMAHEQHWSGLYHGEWDVLKQHTQVFMLELPKKCNGFRVNSNNNVELLLDKMTSAAYRNLVEG